MHTSLSPAPIFAFDVLALECPPGATRHPQDIPSLRETLSTASDTFRDPISVHRLVNLILLLSSSPSLQGHRATDVSFPRTMQKNTPISTPGPLSPFLFTERLTHDHTIAAIGAGALDPSSKDPTFSIAMPPLSSFALVRMAMVVTS